MDHILEACKAIQKATNQFQPEVGIILGTVWIIISKRSRYLEG